MSIFRPLKSVLQSLLMKCFFIGLFVSLFVACSSQEKSLSQSEMNQWHVQMHELADSLAALIPLASSPKEFNDHRNFDILNRETQRLSKLSHVIDETKMKPSSDPSLSFVAKRFHQDMLEANRQLNAGNLVLARFLIRNTTSYCIACHTQTDKGRQFFSFENRPQFQKLNHLDRANFYVAVRNYDQALQEFDQAVNGTEARSQSVQTLEVAALQALAVTIRVKRNAKLAEEMVARIVDSKWAPVYLRLNALDWKRSIRDWQKEEKAGAKPQTPVQQLKQARLLLGRGWSTTSKSPLSRAGLVDFLRASTLLHEIMAKGSRGNNAYGEALYFAGLTAEALRDMNLWTLHETYYEVCIHHQPYSNLAKKCYLRYETLQLANYSNEEGAPLPAHVQSHLDELRALAEKESNEFLKWGELDGGK